MNIYKGFVITNLTEKVLLATKLDKVDGDNFEITAYGIRNLKRKITAVVNCEKVA